MVRTAKSKIGKKEKNDRLYKAILMLETEEECYNFFQDLCTVSELRSMEQRYEVATLLNDGMIYNDILERTGASSAPNGSSSSRICGSTASARASATRCSSPPEICRGKWARILSGSCICARMSAISFSAARLFSASR